MPDALVKSFAPVFSKDSRVLVLGSYPSPKSFAQNFYYGHPQNRFWPLMAALTGFDTPQTVLQKCALILNSGLALWDSLESCTITGASDASIRDPVPNNIASLLALTKVRHIFCNGSAAHKFYHQFNEAATGIAAVRLPSTSPANAAFSLPRLLNAWQPLADALKTRP